MLGCICGGRGWTSGILSGRSEQVCLESSDLLHMHLALAGTCFTVIGIEIILIVWT